MSIALPIAARSRGACPSLDAPMQTGDGLLARLRIAGGRMTPPQMAAIARLASAHGNGLVEVSARGNLQVRGLSAASAGLFARGVERQIEIERGLVVQAPPLAGIDSSEIADPQPIAEAIRRGAAAFEDCLGPKVTVVVDGGGQIGLGPLDADIRLSALGADAWSLSIAGAPGERVERKDATESALKVLQRIAALGVGARGGDLVGGKAKPVARHDRTIGHFALSTGHATGLALPFGGTRADVLIALAKIANAHGVDEFRLAPHHTLLAMNASTGFTVEAEHLGLITHPDDARLRISACIGSDGCASGHVPARVVAGQLAKSLPAGQYLHVSGCTKGCAHPRRADVTLVGRADGYGLVIGGVAGDTPQAVLRGDALEAALALRLG